MNYLCGRFVFKGRLEYRHSLIINTNTTMKRKFLFTLTLLATLMLGITSCKKEDKPGSDPEVRFLIEASSQDIKLLVGKSHQIAVKVEPAGTEVKFESANAEIATVTDKGLVTGVKAGETAIKVTVAGTTKKAKVTVFDEKSADTSVGIGSKTEDFAHFIYIPKTKEDIKKDNVDLFKTIMTAYGWEFYQEMYDYKNNSNVVIPFLSPMVGNEAKFSFSEVRYMHSLKKGPNYIDLRLDWQPSEEDPFDPANQEKLEKDKTSIIYLLKEGYGFKDQSQFKLLSTGDYGWIGINNSTIEDVPLGATVTSHKLTKDDFEVKNHPELEGYYKYYVNILYNSMP